MDSEKLVNLLSNEQHSLANLLESIGLNERYEHNRNLKKSFYSMWAFVSSQIYNHSKDSEYAHAYLGALIPSEKHPEEPLTPSSITINR